MKIAVIGAGAIGGTTAVYLADKGFDVVLIARKYQVDLMKQRGLKVCGVRGEIFASPVVEEHLHEQADLVVLAVKTQDLPQALDENSAFLNSATLLTTQNGVHAEDIVARFLPNARLTVGIVMFGASYMGPGQYVHNFEGDIVIGARKTSSSAHLPAVREVLGRAFSVVISDHVCDMKWLKLFVNANNCIPALLGKSMQETFESTDLCKLALAVWREGLEVVKHAGIEPMSLPDFESSRIDRLCGLPKEKGASVFSEMMTHLSKDPLDGSILQSIKRGRPSEIDHINGAFSALAKTCGSLAPLNTILTELVHQVERTNIYITQEYLLELTKEYL